MPNVKSAKKRVRQNEKRRLRNKSYRSRLKTFYKKFLSAVESKDGDKAKTLLKEYYSVVDKTLKAGVIHKNKAARLKSRATKKFNKLLGVLEGMGEGQQ